MKNGKRNGTGVSKRSSSRQSTVDSRPRRGTQEREGPGAQKEIDARSLWKQVEDLVVPRLGLPVIDHMVYMHLLRHSHLEGKRRLRFSILWLSRNINLTMRPARDAVRRLAAQGVLRFVERTSLAGHVVDVRLPAEVRGVRARAAARVREAARKAGPADLEEVDFRKTIDLRRAIHSRERGRCFYCLRRVALGSGCLDHVVPRARVECNSYRNLVSACMECNSQKADQPAEEYLRWLFRERRLDATERRGRFKALELLADGKLRPAAGMTREGGRTKARLRLYKEANTSGSRAASLQGE
jgi:HNH endonuclease